MSSVCQFYTYFSVYRTFLFYPIWLSGFMAYRYVSHNSFSNIFDQKDNMDFNKQWDNYKRLSN